jgi:hypothetical protein
MDLQVMGYFCPKTGTFDVPTTFAVQVFQEHLFRTGQLITVASCGMAR